MAKMKIEKKIKSLVDILNEVHFINTYSSCEGHYKSVNPDDHRANVLFDIKEGYENALEEMIASVLSRTAMYWSETTIRMMKSFYVMPEHRKLRHFYELYIRPFNQDSSPREKRDNTDKAIKLVVDAVKKYIEGQNAL